MNATVQSILTSYPKIQVPDLPVIELIVSRTLFRWTVGRGGDYGRDLVATAAEILQVKSVVVELFKPNIGDEVPRWQMLSGLFGSLGSRFADIGWFIGALQMSYHDIQIRCALANLQSQPIPLDLSRSSMIPAAPPYHVEFSDAIARLLFHRSLYSANQFCFNDARKASKEAIRIQSELCMHDPANEESASALSWMQRHFASFRRKDAAYITLTWLSPGSMAFPADVTDFDIARALLRHVIQFESIFIAFLVFINDRLLMAGTLIAAGWAMGEYLSFINRRS